MVLRDSVYRTHFWSVPIMPNTDMIIDFAIRMKCGLITENKPFLELNFSRFLLYINKELFAVSLDILCYELTERQFVAFDYRSSSSRRQTVVGGI